jgi:AcrR family transcriptional regulator
MKEKTSKTADLILKVARKLFLKNGFEGTSINEIATLCDINKSLIYHHFESKENLWKAIKEELVKKYTKSEETEISFSHGSLYEFLEEIVKWRFSLYSSHPDLVRLMCWQRLEDNVSKITGVKNKKFINITEEIILLQNKGLIRKDIDPQLISYLILSNSVNVFLDRYEPLITLNKEQKEKNLKQIIDFLYNALKA